MAKTGRLLISHEAPVTGGFASEISSTVQVSLSVCSNALWSKSEVTFVQNISTFLGGCEILWVNQLASTAEVFARVPPAEAPTLSNSPVT